MTDASAKNRKFIALEETDVALIFKADGHLDLNFPKCIGENIPEHLMAALSLSYAAMDDEFFDIIQNRYINEILQTLQEEVEVEVEVEKGPTYEPLSKKNHSTKPVLKVVS